MTKGEATVAKVHLKGDNDDYIVFVDDVEDYKKWLNDSSVPMAHFVSAFNVFVTHNQGVTGQLDKASKSVLSAEFNTEDDEEAIKQILTKGSLQVSEMTDRQGPKNDSMSNMRSK